MGREIRRVPKGWEHPKDERGHYRPLMDQSYEDAAQEWLRELADWEADKDGERSRVVAEYGDEKRYWWDWSDKPPDKEYYRPAWPPESATCYQVYETVSEGTPMSPVFETEDALLQWLLGQGHSELSARAFIGFGWAPSLLIDTSRGLFLSGIDACGAITGPEA